jgi:hypothetical protein
VKHKLKSSLRKLFNIYPGEEKSAFLFALLGFIWAFGASCGLRLSDALFLLNVGSAQLPYAFICIAISLFCLVSIFLYGLNTFSLDRLFLAVLCIGSSIYLFTYLALLSGHFQSQCWFWFFLHVFCTVFLLVLVTCYWSFVDQFFDLQDGKRIFSLLNSAIIFGFACAGGMISLGFFSLDSLFLIVFVSILLSAAYVIYLNNKFDIVHDDTVEHEASNNSISITSIIKSVINSPFTIVLLITNLLLQVLSVLTECHYMSAFESYYESQNLALPKHQAEAALILFLGECSAWVSMGNILFGICCYARMVRRIGVNRVLLIAPLCCFTFFALLYLPSETLIIPILGFVFVEGITYSIEDNNFTLLINAVPSGLKSRIRVAVESLFEPLGMLIGSLLLLIPGIDSILLGVILSIITVSLALAQRSYYTKAILTNLSANALHFERKPRHWFLRMNEQESELNKERLLKGLVIQDIPSKLLSYKALLEARDPVLIAPILKDMKTLEEENFISALDVLDDSSFSCDKLVIEQVQTWLLYTSSSELSGRLSFYLAKQKKLNPFIAYENLYSNNLYLRASAILAIRNPQENLPRRDLTTCLKASTNQLLGLLNSKILKEQTMGISILGMTPSEKSVELLHPFLKSSSLEILRVTVHALSQITDKHCLYCAPLLLDLLAAHPDNQVRLSCLEALGKMNDPSIAHSIIYASSHFRPNERRKAEDVIAKMGLQTVPVLLSLTKDPAMQDSCRLLAGRTLGRIDLATLRNNLFDIVKKETERASFYFYHGHSIQDNNPDLDLDLLRESLMTGVHSIIDFIIQLLSVAGSIEDKELLSRSLKSKNQKTHSHAVETLEKTCDRRIFSLLLPLIDDCPLDHKLIYCLKIGVQAQALIPLLERLSQSPSKLDQVTAATINSRLETPIYRVATPQVPEANFNHFTHELLPT